MGKPIGQQSVGMVLLKILGWFLLINTAILALAFFIWAIAGV